MVVFLGLTLNEGQWLRVFKHRVLSRIFGHKREAGKNRIMQNRLMCIPHPVVVGKPERKRAHGRHRHRWEDVSARSGCIWHRTGTSSRLL